MAVNPLVTVLMPVHNGDKYLSEAIGSILAQTLSDFEFIIVDDGSTDSTVDILADYAKRDSRIRVYHQSKQGIVGALNAGLDLAKGQYIARIDADDWSPPERLAAQVAFMGARPEVGVCGAWVETIGEPAGIVWRYPTDDATIRCRLLFDSALAHPSVMMRRELLTKAHLRYEHEPVEDYDLWVRCARHTRLANIPKILLYYRLHPQQVGQKYQAERLASAGNVRLAQLKCLGLEPNVEEFALHQALGTCELQATRDFIMRTDAWFRKLHLANQREAIYPEPTFSRFLAEYWYVVCRPATQLGWWVWRIFWQSPLSKQTNLKMKTKIKFGVQCGIRFEKARA